MQGALTWLGLSNDMNWKAHSEFWWFCTGCQCGLAIAIVLQVLELLHVSFLLSLLANLGIIA
jgi:hypothetical protein